MDDFDEAAGLEEKEAKGIKPIPKTGEAVDTNGTEETKKTEHLGRSGINMEAQESDDPDDLAPAIPYHYAAAFGPPALLEHEDEKDFMKCWGLFVLDIEPQGMQEWFWTGCWRIWLGRCGATAV